MVYVLCAIVLAGCLTPIVIDIVVGKRKEKHDRNKNNTTRKM